MQRLREQTSIQVATTLDSIWNLRNQVVHQDYKLNILVIINNLESRILKHFHVLEESDSSVDNSNGGMERWKPPDDGIVKLNVDAAFGNGKSTVAVVAQNLKAWAKLTDHLDPSLAEASAITWALKLAELEMFEHIYIESDSKTCLDALTAPIDVCPWKIISPTSLSLELALHFTHCVFQWVR